MQTAVNVYQTDQIVKSAEVIAILERMRELGGLGLCGLLGSLTASANSDGTNYLAASIVSGLEIRVGDTNVPPKQWALLNGIIADYCPAVTLTAAPATGTRYDYVGVQAIVDPTSTFSTSFFNPITKTTSTGTASASNDGFEAQIFQGNGTPGQEATYVPAPWVPLVQLTVVNSAVTAITPLLQSVAQILAPLDSIINNEPGPFTIEGDPASPAAVTVTTVAGDPTVIKIAVAESAAPVTSVNGQTGAVELVVGVSSVNGQTGAVSLAFPVTSVNGQTGAVSLVTGMSSLNGIGGAVVLVCSDGTVGITPSGADIVLSANGGGVGTTYQTNVYSAGSSTINLACPVTLGAGSWRCSAQFRGASTGGSASLTGANAAWSNSDTTVGNSVNENVMQIVGTASSGETPSVTVTFSGGFSETGTLVLTVSRYA